MAHAHSHGHHHSGGEPHDTAHFVHELESHDTWFRHDAHAPHHQQAHGETQAWGIVWFMVGTLVAVVLVCAVVFWFIYEPLMRFEVERAKEGVAINTEYTDMRAQWEKQLSTYEWADSTAGRIRIPLDVAKERVIAEYAASSKK